MPKPRLLLADDHTIVLDGLTRLLEPEFEVVGKAGDGRAMLDLAAKLNPDVIIADISMPLLSGMEALRQLKKKDSRSKVIILSMHADLELAREALQFGASGYVLKHSAAETLSRAIHEALNGRIYVSPRISIDVLSVIQQTSKRVHGTATCSHPDGSVRCSNSWRRAAPSEGSPKSWTSPAEQWSFTNPTSWTSWGFEPLPN